MKIMHKSAALAAALILTAGISVQAADLTVNVSSTDGGTNSTGTVSGADIATALNGTSLEVGHLTVDGESVNAVISNYKNTQGTVNELYNKFSGEGGIESQVKDLDTRVTQNKTQIGALDNQINGDNGLAEKVEVNGYKADTALKVEGNGVLYNHGTDLTTGINLNTSAIEQETKDRTAADQNLQNQITTNKEGIAANSNAISSLNSRVSDLGSEIDNVGAISAALAGLHPLDYDGTGSKFQLAAAMGDYDGSQAAAIGGFYHFNEDVMMSVGGATAFDGDKKAAFNVGVSFRVGSGSSAKRLNSDDVIAQLAAMNDKIAALEAENQKLTEKVAALQDSEAAPKA